MLRHSPWLRPITAVLLLHTAYFYLVILPVAHPPSGAPDTPLPPPGSRIRRMNALVSEYDEHVRRELRTLVKSRAEARDPNVVALVRQLLDPPSNHMVKLVKGVIETPPTVEIMKILDNKAYGFFVDYRAKDGERSSDTLYLEQRMNWTGILIEMDPDLYTQLRGKSRNAYSINACLSPRDHITEIRLREATIGNKVGLRHVATNPEDHHDNRKVHCFPLESILLALNATHVDFFSLDVEGLALEILKTIPFDRLDIRTMAVEYKRNIDGKMAYESFMVSRNYTVRKDLHYSDHKRGLYVDDFIFVKKNPIATSHPSS